MLLNTFRIQIIDFLFLSLPVVSLFVVNKTNNTNGSGNGCCESQFGCR